jgi:hypothetical protein
VRVLAILLPLVLAAVSAAARGDSRDLVRMGQKLNHIEANARSPHPNPSPTIFTEPEVNAYLASDDVQLPAGVQSVKLEGEPGMITGRARIDFDRIREGAHSLNPLLGIFTGIHDVVVVTHAHGDGGRGYVHVDSVSLDNIEVPRFMLQLFVEKFLQPKYPELGLDSRFSLPDRIYTAVVGEHQLTVTQR